MSLYNNKYRIESIRFKDWDYSTPADYYVTILTNKRTDLFGIIEDGELATNDCGKIALETWLYLESYFPNIKLNEFIFMPNHMHAIITIKDKTQKTLGSIVGAYKSLSTKKINEHLQTPGSKIWHERFYDRIIRDEKEFYFISEYIKNNPIKNDPVFSEMEWYDLMAERLKKEKSKNVALPRLK